MSFGCFESEQTKKMFANFLIRIKSQYKEKCVTENTLVQIQNRLIWIKN